jgi:hypothetical protein
MKPADPKGLRAILLFEGQLMEGAVPVLFRTLQAASQRACAIFSPRALD